jgi:RNA polymerase sigma-70 factor (ECF subfamily)
MQPVPLLEAEARAAYEQGQAAWPGAVVAFGSFFARIAELSVTPHDLTARAADLYLAFACAAGDRSAIDHFEREFIANVHIYVRRAGLAASMMGELKQRVRMKLLLGPSPAVARYRGMGPLGAWVRVTAVRVSVDLAAAENGDGRNPSDLLDLCASEGPSPELAAAKLMYRDRFRATLEASFRRLKPREKALLRMHFLEELSLDRLAIIYRVHRSTVARWLVAVRAQVLEDLRTEFGIEGQTSTAELRSLVSVLRNEVQISARRVLASESA